MKNFFAHCIMRYTVLALALAMLLWLLLTRAMSVQAGGVGG